MRQAFGFFKKEQKAYTGLESAIILATFVMVAAIFAHTVLNTGVTASTVSHIDKSNDKRVINNELRNTNVCSQESGDRICQKFSSEIEHIETEKMKSSVELNENNTSEEQNNQINEVNNEFN